MPLPPIDSPSFDPRGYQSLRASDDISPKAAKWVGAILRNLKTGGDLFVGNIQSPVPIDEYLASGGPENVPVFITIHGATTSADARPMYNALMKPTIQAATIIYGAFDGVQPAGVVSHIMSLFPELETTLSKGLEAIAMKGV